MKHDQENLEFLARQYHWLRRAGDNHDKALSKLESKLDASFQPLIARMGSSQNGFSPSDPFIVDRLGTLTRVLDVPHQDTSARNSLLVNALFLSDELRELGKHIRDQLLPRLTYIMMVGLVGFIVSSIYSIYVLPNIGSVGWVTSDKVLPPMDDMNGRLYSLFFLAFCLIAFCFYWMCGRSTYKLGGEKSFAAPLHRLPGFAELNRAIQAHVHLRLLQLYSRSGFDVDQAAKFAHSFARTDDTSMKNAMRSAWQLDTLENELAFQQERSSELVNIATKKMIALWVTAFSILAALVIGKMVIDFYLPLFKQAG